MAGGIFSWFRSLFSDFFISYSTVKEIEIRDTYVGILHRILQFVVCTYIAVYIVWTKKGYQDAGEPRGSSIIKVKGVARVSTNTSNFKTALWDTSEYLIPPLENNAFFIATRKTVTYDQTPSTCPSAPNNKLFCNSTNNSCKQGMQTPDAFGFLTGKCVTTENNSKNSVCEVNAWCPEELSNSTDYKININDLQTFTVFIKTVVSFTQYNIKIRTVRKNTNFSCRFNSETDPTCPIFSIGYILQSLHKQNNNIDFMSLYHQGGLIEIEQNWQCNFDFSREEKECYPIFMFHLLQSGNDVPSPGINYRFAEKYRVNEKEYRTLTKVYGLRFVLAIRGKGRRFNIVNLFLAIGSGVGYMIIAEIVCEFIFTNLHKYRKEYYQNKIETCRLNQSNQNDSTRLTILSNPLLTQSLISSQTKTEDQSIAKKKVNV